MSIPPLTIVPAGAGSGKTHAIQERLVDWVKRKLVRPEAIVAVTFTEAAAAELRGRIRAALLAAGRTEDTLRLERAYISTIHGFGLRLLTEFAFDNGFNPGPRKLDDSEEALLIRRAIAGTRRADGIMQRLWAYGYRYNGGTEQTAEAQFRGRIRGLLDLLRSVNARGDQAPWLAQVDQHIRDLYGATGDAAALNKALLSAVQRFLNAFPENLSGQFQYKNANDGVGRNFQLCKAVNGESVQSDWLLWQNLRQLYTSSGRTQLPDGYDVLAEAVMDAANALPRHPGPLIQELGHAEGLVAAGMEAQDIYELSKRESGLLDYTDMLALTEQLLSSVPGVVDFLRREVDCLVIDEFQDTNPLQFSLLWHLQMVGIPTLVVGDLKQAIMGFQHADARLLAELIAQNPADAEPLRGNWRSTAELMGFINAVGEGLFGKNYTDLEPRAKLQGKLPTLQVVEFLERGTNRTRADHVAVCIRSLLNEKHQVWDRRREENRALRPGDIAMLCPTHKSAEEYAAALRGAGIRAQLTAAGWLESPIVQLACAALGWVADPSDRHAALTLAVTELGSLELQPALAAMLDGKPLKEPLLDILRPVADGPPDRSVPTLLRETIDALGLYDAIAAWPDAAQARANLLLLQEQANTFAGANRDALEAGGFYGSGLMTFLAWLSQLAEETDADRQPDPRMVDDDAVEVVTWHASKGREWPVVAVCGTNYSPPLHLPATRIDYTDFSDLARITERARLEVYPNFTAKEQQENFLNRLIPEHTQERLRLLYVALTRARESLLLEWQTHTDSKEVDTHKRSLHQLFTQETGLSLEGSTLKIGKRAFPCKVVQAGKESPIDAEDDALADPDEPLSPIGRRAIEVRPLLVGLTPEFVTPSELAHVSPPNAVTPVLTTHAYGRPLKLNLPLLPAEQGTLLHACFEVLGGDVSRVAQLNTATGYDFNATQTKAIAQAVDSFDTWLQTEWAPLSIERELPLLVMDFRGSVVNGIMDLLVETDDGFWIIDHKSDQTDDPDGRFADYLIQLEAYAAAVRQARPDKPILGLGINWIRRGEVSLL